MRSLQLSCCILLLQLTITVIAQQVPPYDYLPPNMRLALPEEPAATTPSEELIIETEVPETTPIPEPAAPESAVLGDNGYEYRSVRRLKYRQRIRRDVAHLAPAYLPPEQQQRYLPPANNVADDVDAPKKVYLPPAAAVSTEAEPVEAITEPVAAIEAEDDAPQQEPEQEAEAPSEEEQQQDTTQLRADGYHYKQPTDAMPMPQAEYLPPMQPEQQDEKEEPKEEEETEDAAVGPADSAVLREDGYHYRAFKRL